MFVRLMLTLVISIPVAMAADQDAVISPLMDCYVDPVENTEFCFSYDSSEPRLEAAGVVPSAAFLSPGDAPDLAEHQREVSAQHRAFRRAEARIDVMVLSAPEPQGFIIESSGEYVDKMALDNFLNKSSVADYRIVTIDVDYLREFARLNTHGGILRADLLEGYSVNIVLAPVDMIGFGGVPGAVNLVGRIEGNRDQSSSIHIQADGKVQAFIGDVESYYLQSFGASPYHILWRRFDIAPSAVPKPPGVYGPLPQ